MSDGTPDSDGAVRAAILVTGTEVLTATIRDENGPWLSEQLTGLGVELVEILIVADHRRRSAATVWSTWPGIGVDLIITTGRSRADRG